MKVFLLYPRRAYFTRGADEEGETELVELFEMEQDGF